jgi:ABC-type dipeptide/oligopeptide/nickel transport system permease subunit
MRGTARTLLLSRAPSGALLAAKASTRWLARRPRAGVGIAMVGGVLVVALFAPLVAPHTPNAQDFQPLLGPRAGNLFGTDDLGRDVFSRVIYGARISVVVSFVGVGAGAAIGVTLGLLAAMRPGVVGGLIMRTMDIFLAYPGIVLGIAIVALFGPGSSQIALGVAVFNVPVFARLTHGSVVKERSLDYARAAISLGASRSRLAFQHLLPNALPAIVPQLSLSLGGGVLIEAALSFLGFGAQPPTPSWGGMLAESRPYLSVAPFFGVLPGLALALFVVGFNLIGDSLRRGRVVDLGDDRSAPHPSEDAHVVPDPPEVLA